MSTDVPIVRLSELAPGESADCFVLLAAKDRSQTRDGNPYFRATFRDVARNATAMIWNDSPWFAPCEREWCIGGFYKIRCQYAETQYGPQVDLQRVREVEPEDHEQGFDPSDFFLSSRHDPSEMFEQLLQIVEEQIEDAPLRELVRALLDEHAEDISTAAAAARNHHAFRGGYLEHVLSVTQTALFLADKYVDAYPRMRPPLSKSLVVAGAILHDIGKLIELSHQPHGASYTARGQLIGHISLGRDIIRDKAKLIDELDEETLLRLEHIIIAHQNRPEWGSPIAPHTPEALLVHYADDIDAKFHMMAEALKEPVESDDEFTNRDNGLRRNVFRGLRGGSE